MQRRYSEAEPLLKEGYEEIKLTPGEKHPRTIEAIQRLIQFYQATKNPRSRTLQSMIPSS